MSSSNKNKKVSDTSSSSLPPGRGRGRSTALNPLTDHEGLANALKNLQALRRHRPDGTNHILSPTARNHVEILQGFRDNLRSLAREPLDVLVMETLPLNVRKRVEVLKQIQRRHDELEARFVEERAALEAKYQKHYEPLYTKRNGIVNGIVEVASSESALDQEEDKATEEKGVPNFWLTAMKNNEILLKEISEHDEDALKYLKDIKWCRTDEPKGFKLDFFFDANPYFKDTILTKTYQMIDEVEPILQEAIGMKIEWFPGKSLTQKVLKTKPKKGRRIIVKTEDCESFFNFFSPPQDQTAKDSLTKLEHDYNIGTTIRDKLIPHAVSWFVEKAIKEDVVENIDGDDDDKREN